MANTFRKIVALVIVMALVAPISVFAHDFQAQMLSTNQDVDLTILHTNDFHGRLQPDAQGRGGAAYLAGMINQIRAEVDPDHLALVDAGDLFFAAPAISQLLLGESTIDIFNLIGYDFSVLGNHEFDKGQEVLQDRITQSNFPWLGANVVLEGTEWDNPAWVDPYLLLTFGAPPDEFTVGFLGLAGEETPLVTLLGTTEGLVFKDLAETIQHYYDEILAQADALVVVAHMGTNDSGAFDGLVTVAQKLIAAEQPVGLMIGGHQHQALFEPVWVEDTTAIVSAGQYGRFLGRVGASIDPMAKMITLEEYELITINTTLEPDEQVAERVAYWAELVAPLVEQPVAQTNISLVRDYNNESVMGDIVSDSMLWNADLLDDGELNGSVDIAFTNPGGLRADIIIPEGAELPYTITWGETFEVLPFGNTLYLMDLTGAQIQDLLDQSASLFKGILQASGTSYSWFNDTGDDQPNQRFATDIMVGDDPLVMDQVYRVVTNDFLAGGQDGWVTFAEGTNRLNTFFDMQEGFVDYLQMLEVVDPEDVPMGRINRVHMMWFPWVVQQVETP